MPKHLVNFIFITILMGSSTIAIALPESSRYGQFSCTGCHVSPGGGGTLTAYGRMFAEQKLSTWARYRESDPLGGLVPVDDSLLWGGDLRWAFLRRQSGDQSFQKLWRMQADFEATARLANYWGTLILGTEPAGPSTETSWSPELRGYALRGDFWGERITTRLGLFLPKFGLMLSDHTAYVRIAAGLGPEQEQTQWEVIYSADQFELTASLLLPVDFPKRAVPARSGLNLGLSGFMWRQRLNLNLLLTQAESDSQSSQQMVLGISGVASFGSSIFALAEIDYVSNAISSSSGDTSTQGLANLFSLNAEVIKGLSPYVRYEFWDSDSATDNTSRSRWGLGGNWYPRPHLQLEGRFFRGIVNQTKTASNQVDVILHYYF